MKNKVNEIKVSYSSGIPPAHWQKISNSQEAYNVLYEYWDKNTIELQESFSVVLMNNSHNVKDIYQLSQGGISGTIVDLRLLFAVVLKTLSVSIILSHNHPSGNLKASKADIELTKKIKNAAAFFDINVVDHLILIPHGGYLSFADNGLL